MPQITKRFSFLLFHQYSQEPLSPSSTHPAGPPVKALCSLQHVASFQLCLMNACWSSSKSNAERRRRRRKWRRRMRGGTGGEGEGGGSVALQLRKQLRRMKDRRCLRLLKGLEHIFHLRRTVPERPARDALDSMFAERFDCNFRQRVAKGDFSPETGSFTGVPSWPPSCTIAYRGSSFT